MARSGSCFLCLLIFIFSCSDDFQRRYYDYQVERLLTSGDSAIWTPTSILLNGNQLLGTCQDSVLFMIELNSNDSLQLTRLRPTCLGDFLYTASGSEKGKASQDAQIFTDSILFANGNYWLVNSVFSRSFEIQSGDTIMSFAYQPN